MVETTKILGESISVLLVTPEMEYTEKGIYTFNLIKGLLELEHDIFLATPPGPLLDELEETRVEIGLFPFLKDRRLELFRARTIRDRLDVDDADVLHALDWRFHPFVQPLARRVGAPYFLSVDTTLESPKKLPGPLDELDAVIVSADATREYVVNDLGVPKEKVEVIRPGVDLQRLRPKPILQEDHEPILAISCPLVEGNDVHLFAEIARRVSENGVDAQYLVIGQGPLDRDLRRRFVEYGLEADVVFQTNPRVYYDILPDIDIYISPEPTTGSGLLVLEAMGCGKPAIASGAGGGYHVIRDEDTGFVVSPDTGAEEMADKILYLLSNPGTAREMGERAAGYVRENFQLSTMVSQTVTCYGQHL